MTLYKPTAVVLVRFPFTDLSSIKKRPAVVINTEEYNERYGDVIIVPLTSVDQKDESLRLSYWKESGLIKSTWIKPLVATVTNSLIERELGHLHQDDTMCIRVALRQIFARFIWEV